MKKCIVIGSGLGGLSSGVVLAKNGYAVTVVEQSNQIGGCLQCFWRDGVKFETGMHFIGSMDEGQVLSRYLNYLEINDKITLSRLNPDAYDVVLLQGERFTFPCGRAHFVAHFSERFPSQRENLERYCDLVEQVASRSPFRSHDPETSPNFIDDDLFYKSINAIIDETITDPLLREVLVGNLSLYAAQKDKTPFSTHAFVFDFYNQSAFRVVGGSDQIAIALAEVLQSYGGQILTEKKVTKILVDKTTNEATGVLTDDGLELTADIVISDVHPKQLVEMVEPRVFTEAYLSRIRQIPDTTSVFSLFLRFKEKTVPYLNSNYYGFQVDSPWAMSDTVDAEWPRGYLYMHHCYEPNQKFAKGGVVLAYMSADAVQPWNDTKVGRRGADYEQFKQAMAERLLDAVEKDFPRLRDALADYYVATPLTYRDYTLTPNGAMYGMAKDVQLGIVGRVSFKTKVPNLLLVGQNINAHGMLGVLVGTMKACGHLIGEDELKRQMEAANRKTVLVIGGGLGGLVTGALLAKENYKVTVLEKNAIIGGGLQSFKRHGASFPTGMHIFGGFEADGNMRKLFNYLGILDKISIRPTDETVSDVVTFASDGTRYQLPKGKENFVQYLSALFPAETEGIKAYVEKLFALSQEEALFYLRENDTISLDHSDDFLMPYDELIDRYIHDAKLKALLCYLNPLFDGVRGVTPAYIHALLSVLHINGTWQFEGDSLQMAQALARVIEDAGGQVIADEEVTKIEVNNHQVTQVVTNKGNVYKSNYYISDVHLDVLLRIIDENAFTPAFRKRIGQVPETSSCFKVFVKFKNEAFPFMNHANFCFEDYTYGLNAKETAMAQWPRDLMFVTPPTQNQGAFADTMVILSPMPFDWVREWEHTLSGRRGDAYAQWKQRMTEQVLDRMESLCPGFRDKTECVFAASPLTIRDFYGNKEGSCYGFSKDSHQLMLSQLAVKTKIGNLLLTGQNVNLHGLCGVSLTAIETAEALVGRNVIVRKINNP